MKKLPSDFVFVLIGPLADSEKLIEWAHTEFRRSAGVLFIGVDRGVEVLETAGLPISFAIGDFDSLSESAMENASIDGTFSGTPMIRLKHVKERSDLAYALEFCVEQGARTLYAYGFQGGRMDHEFAVHLDLSEASRKIPRVVSVGERGVGFYLSAKHGPLKLKRATLLALRDSFLPKAPRKKAPKKRQPDFVSLFPIGGEARGVKFHGLRFPAANGILSLSSQGLSNEIRSATLEVQFKQGRLALFFPAHHTRA